MPERQRYRTHKLRAGDYLVLGNDGKTLFRVVKYEDGPSLGLDWPSDREVWRTDRWTGGEFRGLTIKAVADADSWDCIEQLMATRREAIQVALDAAPSPKGGTA